MFFLRILVGKGILSLIGMRNLPSLYKPSNATKSIKLSFDNYFLAIDTSFETVRCNQTLGVMPKEPYV